VHSGILGGGEMSNIFGSDSIGITDKERVERKARSEQSRQERIEKISRLQIGDAVKVKNSFMPMTIHCSHRCGSTRATTKMTKRTGRPTEYESGAMATLRVRVPQRMLDYLDSKGNRSKAARAIIERAMRDEQRKQECEQ